MAITFLTPSEVGDQYLTYLKGLRPDVDVSQQDSDWWVRSRVVGGVMSGVYADQLSISTDAFPQSARSDALARHLDLYFGSGFIQPTQSDGIIGVTGTIGTVYSIGTEWEYEPNQNIYQATEQVTITTPISATLASGQVPVISVATGQSQNLLLGAQFTASSPPAGDNGIAVAITNIADGRDIETDEEAAARILARVQFPPAGGNVKDYKAWALQADPSVIDSNVIRFIYGPGTVGVVILAGTTNIDEALNSGSPIVQTPSDSVIQIVQDYIDAVKPLTDCAFVIGPTLIDIDVTVNVRFFDGDANSIPTTQLTNQDGSIQTLTQGQLVIREVQRAIYKTPPGGRQFGASGFVVKSEIEQVIDDNLSAEPYNTGLISSILIDRDVNDLSASGNNLMILPNELPQPGVITLVVMD